MKLHFLAPTLGATPQTYVELTPRELNVIVLVGSGLSNKETARRLGLSEKSIKNRLHLIYHNLGFRSRVDLAIWATTQHISLDKSIYLYDTTRLVD